MIVAGTDAEAAIAIAAKRSALLAYADECHELAERATTHDDRDEALVEASAALLAALQLTDGQA